MFGSAFGGMVGIAGGLVPMYGMIRASDAGGPLNIFLHFVSAGTTGLLNMLGCVGCYINFSYTYKEGFGFGMGWSVTAKQAWAFPQALCTTNAEPFRVGTALWGLVTRIVPA